MAFDWLNVVASVLAVLPAAVALLWAYSRYDGFFKDNIIFLYFVGGLIAGIGVVIFHFFLQPYNAFFIVGVPLVEQFAKTVVLNRRKWQGEPHAVFNGGAFGAGVGVMVSLWYAKGFLKTLDPGLAIQVLGLAVGVTFTAIATGWAVGAGIRDRKPFRGAIIAAAASVPVAFLVLYWVEFGDAWVPALLALTGLLLLGFGIAKVLPGGLSAEDLREYRRRRRARIRESP